MGRSNVRRHTHNLHRRLEHRLLRRKTQARRNDITTTILPRRKKNRATARRTVASRMEVNHFQRRPTSTRNRRRSRLSKDPGDYCGCFPGRAGTLLAGCSRLTLRNGQPWRKSSRTSGSQAVRYAGRKKAEYSFELRGTHTPWNQVQAITVLHRPRSKWNGNYERARRGIPWLACPPLSSPFALRLARE